MWQWVSNLFGTAPPSSVDAKSNTARAGATPIGRADDEPLLPPFLRREAILNRKQQVVAYVFTVETPAAMQMHHWQASTRKFFDNVLIDHFASNKLADLLNKRLAFLPLGPAGLANPKLIQLPSQNLVIEFDPPSTADFDAEAVLAQLNTLQSSGFHVACGHHLEQRGLAEALKFAHTICLGDVANMAPPDLLARCRELRIRYPESRLIARNIDSTELYQVCQRLNMDLFQGGFLTHRTTSATNKVSPYRVFVVELLNAIRRQVDYGELAGIAWRDPVLAYRLLRFVNSAAFGLRTKIERLRHAMAYVGRDELYRWLTLLLFSNNEPNHLDDALRENALVRARLAENLAEGRMTPKECDEAFVVGILSLIDALLEIPMKDALAQLSLPDAVAAALLHREGKYAPYLKLAIACEESDQHTLKTLAAECGLEASTVNQRHIDALVWTMNFNDTLNESMLVG